MNALAQHPKINIGAIGITICRAVDKVTRYHIKGGSEFHEKINDSQSVLHIEGSNHKTYENDSLIGYTYAMDGSVTLRNPKEMKIS